MQICFAGSVNGGVWRTTSCRDWMPDWTPLTDDQESLSISDLVFDEDDDSGNTILVGIGTRSSLSRIGGIAIGLLYTENALDPTPTWQVLDNAQSEINFRENNVKFINVFARGDLMMAAAYDADPSDCPNMGIFRSTDRGASWTNVLSGYGRALAPDPNEPNRFYAAVDETGKCLGMSPPNGVYKSDDAGLTWQATSTTTSTTIPEGELTNAKLSVSADGSRVWSGT
jgi:hypothetical protein